LPNTRWFAVSFTVFLHVLLNLWWLLFMHYA
jgi:hypothetical protein